MKKRIIGGVIALALVVTTVNLGLWQLSRHNEKQRLADRVESRIDLEPVGLEELYEESVLSGGVGLLGGEDGVKQVEYRRVAESGRFNCDRGVLIRNRTLDGRPGYWVFTPFAVLEEGWEEAYEETDADDALEEQAIYIVNRGWLPLEFAKDMVASETSSSSVSNSEFLPPLDDLLSALPPPNPNPCNTTGVEITGFIRLPRSGAAKECESLAPVCTFAHPDIQAIASHFLSLEDDPLDVGRDFYIQLESAEPPPDGPSLVLRVPAFDAGNHLSYAVQWFIFGTIVVVGYILIFWRKAVFKHRGSRRAPSSD